MSLLDAYQEGTETVGQFMQDRPLEPPKPKPKRSGWTTLPRAVAAGLAEVGANVSDVLGASAQAYADFGMTQNPLQPMTDQQRAERDQAIKDFSPNFRPEQSKPLYEFSNNLRVDPDTATFAENLFFSIGKGLTKAIGGAVAGGPIGGAATLGLSEGMTTAEDLAAQGVDLQTRTGVGATVGVISGASALLPVAGQTLKQTAALALIGGPGAFVAQQKISSEILKNANYVDIAQQYDPLDPVGLTVAALLPFGLGVHSMKAASRATARQTAKGDTSAAPTAEVQPGVQDAQPAPVKTQNFETQENVDVAMVQNLTVQRDIADSTPVAKYAAELSKQEVTDNPNFKNWFGESKVIDQEGKPLIVYHGTKAEFDSFDPATVKNGRGFWFAGGDDVASRFAAAHRAGDPEAGQNIIPVYLRMNNPYIHNPDLKMTMDNIFNAAREGGHDGIIFTGKAGSKGAFVVFDNKQIKSAIGNSGLFDPNSSSLTDQIIRTTEQARASQTRTAESNPLKPADNQPTVIAQQIERMVTENPNMHVSVREDGTRVRLADEVEAVRREIMNGTDDELGTNDAKLVEAAINCFLGD